MMMVKLYQCSQHRLGLVRILLHRNLKITWLNNNLLKVLSSIISVVSHVLEKWKIHGQSHLGGTSTDAVCRNLLIPCSHSNWSCQWGIITYIICVFVCELKHVKMIPQMWSSCSNFKWVCHSLCKLWEFLLF